MVVSIVLALSSLLLGRKYMICCGCSHSVRDRLDFYSENMPHRTSKKYSLIDSSEYVLQ